MISEDIQGPDLLSGSSVALAKTQDGENVPPAWVLGRGRQETWHRMKHLLCIPAPDGMTFQTVCHPVSTSVTYCIDPCL